MEQDIWALSNRLPTSTVNLVYFLAQFLFVENIKLGKTRSEIYVYAGKDSVRIP